MLISGHKIAIKKNVELTRLQCQFLIDFEAMLANAHIVFDLLCLPCASVGDDAKCSGAADLTGEHPTFTVECGCSRRAYAGSDLIPPVAPSGLVPRTLLHVQKEIALTRDEMRLFDQADQLLRQLRLKYAMRCLRCRDEDRDSDGIWGAKDSTQNEFIVECACTKRVYKGADAPATGH